MKTFISWSGPVSHRVAQALRDWLPLVIQRVDPYVSSEDIEKGRQWLPDISSTLGTSSYGILCITYDNVNSPWLNFEAGALSRSSNKPYVTPFLFDVGID